MRILPWLGYCKSMLGEANCYDMKSIYRPIQYSASWQARAEDKLTYRIERIRCRAHHGTGTTQPSLSSSWSPWAFTRLRISPHLTQRHSLRNQQWRKVAQSIDSLVTSTVYWLVWIVSLTKLLLSVGLPLRCRVSSKGGSTGIARRNGQANGFEQHAVRRSRRCLDVR